MADHRFWVGPVGALRALPDVAATVAVPVTRIGGMHRSLAGGLTIDTFARKRAWTWSYETLLSSQLAYLEALQYGTIPGPLRLIDPHRFNRLPEDLATGGSVTRSNATFGVDAGSFASWAPLTDVTTADLSTLGPSALLRGCQRWRIVVPGTSNYLRADEPIWASDRRARIPVLPGETLRVSIWVLGPTSAQLTLGIGWHNAGNVRYRFDTVTDYTTLALDTWTEFTADVAVPDDGAVSMYPILETDDTHVGADTTIYATAWQVGVPNPALEPAGRYTHHCEVEDVSAGWHIGGGAPYVVADVGEVGYPPTVLGFTSAGLTLYET